MAKTDEKIIEELNQAIEEAQGADGFFITITRKVKDKLHHFQTQMRFNVDDCILSLNECEKLVRGANPKTPVSIARFKPRTYK